MTRYAPRSPAFFTTQGQTLATIAQVRQAPSCLKLLKLEQRYLTVSQCLAIDDNSLQTDQNIGYYYNGGHFQKLATELSLGGANSGQLAKALEAKLGPELGIGFDSPQPAGGAAMSAAGYARFLRKILRGELKIAEWLGREAVCTNPTTCPTAISTPTPEDLSWHYSLGHWVEDDPASGDGAFSSAGAQGFYPWISADKTLYGIVARQDAGSGAGMASATCGAAVRQAWVLGVALP